MTPLTDDEYNAQSWAGTQDAVATVEETGKLLCAVQLSQRKARPWLLTLHAPTAGGALVVPTTPTPPTGAVAIAAKAPALPASVLIRLGPDTVVCDYPPAGACYEISSASQVQVSLYATWAGGIAPEPVPRYSARLTELAARSGSRFNVPTYTWTSTVIAGNPAVYSVVPVRAVAAMVSIQPEAVYGDGTSGVRVTWRDATGAVLGGQEFSSQAVPGAPGFAPAGTIPIPRNASAVSVEALGPEHMRLSLVYFLSL